MSLHVTSRVTTTTLLKHISDSQKTTSRHDTNECESLFMLYAIEPHQKERFTFIAFDVVDFYPSISVDLLGEALQFASNYVNITDEEQHIILHAKKSLLYNMRETWGKKTTSDLFDVTMGSFDGAES